MPKKFEKGSEIQEEKNARLIAEGKLSFRELEQLGGSLPSSALSALRSMDLNRQNTSQVLSQSR